MAHFLHKMKFRGFNWISIETNSIAVTGFVPYLIKVNAIFSRLVSLRAASSYPCLLFNICLYLVTQMIDVLIASDLRYFDQPKRSSIQLLPITFKFTNIAIRSTGFENSR